MEKVGTGVEVESISRQWGEFNLEDISFDIEPGEYFCILGPTGGGKTLLLELLAGFHMPDSGEIRFNGEDITCLPPEKRGIGFVYQQHMLFPHLNVFDNIAFGLKIRRVSRDEIKHRVEEIAEKLGIEKILDRYVDNLSGGEQQRISLARALLLRPGLLLLDEPTSSLDQQTRESLLDLLRRVHRESGVTVVHITHDRQEAIALANRIAIMDMGRVVQVGATDSVFRQPLTDFVARFLGSENIFRGTAQRRESLTEISVGDVKVIASKPAEGEVSITIRPEDIILVQKRAGTSARNVLSGRIVELAEQGALVRVTLDCGVPLVVFVTRQSFIDMELNVGSRIYAYFKAQSVHVF